MRCLFSSQICWCRIYFKALGLNCFVAFTPRDMFFLFTCGTERTLLGILSILRLVQVSLPSIPLYKHCTPSKIGFSFLPMLCHWNNCYKNLVALISGYFTFTFNFFMTNTLPYVLVLIYLFIYLFNLESSCFLPCTYPFILINTTDFLFG